MAADVEPSHTRRMAGGGHAARDAYEAFIGDWHPRPAISVAEERELRAVIRGASLAWGA